MLYSFGGKDIAKGFAEVTADELSLDRYGDIWLTQQSQDCPSRQGSSLCGWIKGGCTLEMVVIGD